MTETPQVSAQALLDAARVFEERIPFNQVLGLRMERLGESDVVVRFDMRDELIGNFTRGNLHGGVISSVLDVVGGLVAFIALLRREGVQSLEDEADKFSRLGTIDLRVDYLQAWFRQDLFRPKGFVLRAGRKVAVTRNCTTMKSHLSLSGPVLTAYRERLNKNLHLKRWVRRCAAVKKGCLPMADTPSPETRNLSPGDQLRNARQGYRWSVEDVAANLNLTVDMVRALESGDTEAPGPTLFEGHFGPMPDRWR